MYEMYARRRNWKFDLMSYNEEEKGGGVREAMAEINSNGNPMIHLNEEDGEEDELANGGVYKNLKFESAVHRVQRPGDGNARADSHLHRFRGDYPESRRE